jgi:hypothetical protein
LKYIIKNYRSDSKEELQEFYRKVGEYRPNIEEELTAMLAEANNKNRETAAVI